MKLLLTILGALLLVAAAAVPATFVQSNVCECEPFVGRDTANGDSVDPITGDVTKNLDPESGTTTSVGTITANIDSQTPGLCNAGESSGCTTPAPCRWNAHGTVSITVTSGGSVPGTITIGGHDAPLIQEGSSNTYTATTPPKPYTLGCNTTGHILVKIRTVGGVLLASADFDIECDRCPAQ